MVDGMIDIFVLRGFRRVNIVDYIWFEPASACLDETCLVGMTEDLDMMTRWCARSYNVNHLSEVRAAEKNGLTSMAMAVQHNYKAFVKNLLIMAIVC